MLLSDKLTSEQPVWCLCCNDDILMTGVTTSPATSQARTSRPPSSASACRSPTWRREPSVPASPPSSPPSSSTPSRPSTPTPTSWRTRTSWRSWPSSTRCSSQDEAPVSGKFSGPRLRPVRRSSELVNWPAGRSSGVRTVVGSSSKSFDTNLKDIVLKVWSKLSVD